MRLDVEAGPRESTVLVRLYGRLTAWDGRHRILTLTPVHGHRALDVPVHRIVALSGDRERRGRDEPPMWEPYAPARHRPSD